MVHTKEWQFIAVFTVGFVIAALVILGAGYVVLTATGVLGPHNASAPTATPGVTPGPTQSATIYVTATPRPSVPAQSTATPPPTPTPSPYKFNMLITPSTSSVSYKVDLWLGYQSQPLDMTQVTFSVWDGMSGNVYHNYDFTAIAPGAQWVNSNGDNRLDPTNEHFVFTIDAAALGLPSEVDSKLSVVLNGEKLTTTTLPALKNPLYVVTIPPNWKPTPTPLPPGQYW